MEKQNSKNNKKDFRLNKYLSRCGVASRRTADELIGQGRVAVNGTTVTELGVRIDSVNDRVTVDGEAVRPPDRFVYVLLNKPKDYITTVSDERGRKTVMDLVPLRTRLYPVGRLDRHSTGVLLLTNDGDLAHRLMHPRYRVEKAYVARLDRPLQESDRKKLLQGVMIDWKPAKVVEATPVEGTRRLQVGIVLHEGRNRQVRRMFEALDYEVAALDRVVYAGLTCAGVDRGGWRHLTKREVEDLKALAAPAKKNLRNSESGSTT
jgi:23S rRNA pseudouridine2605 synthase